MRSRRNLVQVLFNIVCLGCCVTTERVCGQYAPDSALKNTLAVFTNALHDQAGIYNGIQYRRYPGTIHEGHPFYMADSLVAGTVTYDGLDYRNIKLLYDEVNDELITTDWQGDNLVQLLKERVNGFSMGMQQFVHLKGAYPAAGYYRVIYDGKSTVIAREKKEIQVKTGRTTAETERWVSRATDYYIKTPGGYRKFNRLNSFLSILGSHRRQVANYIRQNRMHFKSEKDRVLAQAARYYDQQTN